MNSKTNWLDRMLNRKNSFFKTESLSASTFPATYPTQDPLYTDLGFRVMTGDFKACLFRVVSLNFFEPDDQKSRSGDVMVDFDLDILQGNSRHDVEALGESKEFTTLTKKIIRSFVESAIANAIASEEKKK